MTASDSAWLKIRRAEHHLVEINEMLRPYQQIRPYAVAHSVEGNPQHHVYRVWVREQPHTDTNPDLALAVGDFFQNLRSALDHMMIAIAPSARRKKLIYFPIFTDDFRKRCEACGQQLKRDRDNEAVWDSWTKDMNPEAVAYIFDRQPFNNPPVANPDLAVDDNSLVILKRLNNADKHRHLVGFASGVDVRRVWVTDGDVTTEGRMRVPPNVAGQDGAEIFISPHEVEVKAEGSIVIAVRGSSDRLYKLPGACEGPMSWVASEIIPKLDRFARD